MSPSERSSTGGVVTPFIISRLLIAGMIGLSRLAMVPGPLWTKGGLLGALTGGDAAIYLGIAQSHQWFGSSGYEPAIRFFPVFPLLVKAMSFLLLGNVAVAGVVVANLALLAAGFLFSQLLKFEGYPDRVQRMALMFLMLSPASYFFSCAIADSTALMLALGCLLAARKGNWLGAVLLALCLCGTMNVGFWIIIPLFAEYVIQNRSRGLWQRTTLLLALVPLHLGVVVMLGPVEPLFISSPLRLSHDWLQVFKTLVAQSEMFLSYRVFYAWLFWFAIVAIVALCIAALRWGIRRSYVAYTAAIIFGCAWAYDMEAVRTLGLAFPLFIVLGVCAQKYERVSDLALICSITLLMLSTLAAANGFWLT